ncbi:AAHS family 4-hydroxybenzoate transporter-like MFS transporter [Paraburkholderia sp. BL23I1N1]|uniref:MFS transporter n=1 Tax=Paraburkholderia sp. BL23I1N1 TaxID=1938802 RepID=UPI000E760BF9|nr:MFS transporter [Paraburkholderia sp. BL23I1N1]RKE39019.1 AAHS family 4-hydroxybenzoate transporter-like MFS transporter [Paraburkholderia sp. BL23I1N1]
MSEQKVGIGAAIDVAPFGPSQQFIVVMCALIALLDGFDTQAIAFVAPVIASHWALPGASFGRVFGAGLAGLMVGALLLGPVADRLGRRTVILTSVSLFGLFSIATVFAGSLNALLLPRFLTGLGLGGAMPNIIALTAEYAPARLRATTVSVMFCGFPMGAVLGGFAAARTIPLWGWQSVFVMGGVLPLLMVPVLAIFLPESLRFLSDRAHLRGHGEQVLRRVLGPRRAARVDMDAEVAPPATRIPVAGLFTEHRAGGTLLLWVTCFMNLLMLYFLANWLPTLLKQGGISLDRAIISTALLNLGGVVSALVIDRWRPGPVLAAAYVMAAICTYGIGQMTQAPFALLMTMVFIVGFCVIGGQISLNALAANLYPTAIRATGVGWALGFGRIGSIIGPVVGGLLIASGLDLTSLFAVSALPGLIAAVAVWLLTALRAPRVPHAQVGAT